MGKTNKTIFLMGDYVPVYVCDQCGEETNGSSLYWEKKDFSLCGGCLEESYKLMFEIPRPEPKTNKSKKPIPKEIKEQMLLRDGYKCRYCGCADNLTADHILPESKGGPATLENLATACVSCNSRKGARLPEEAGMTLKRV